MKKYAWPASLDPVPFLQPLASVFPGIPRNLYKFHLQQNAQAYVPKQEIKTSVSADIRSIFKSLALTTQNNKHAVPLSSSAAQSALEMYFAQ